MGSADYPAIRKHLLKARQLQGEARRAYLDALSPPVRAEVESLLAQEGGAEILATGGLAAHVDDELLSRLEEDLVGPLPERVGSYRPLEVLGHGGMGVVYRAEQVTPIQREVAVKVIKRGMDTRRVVARFEAERQTLAQLEHPNIAQVLDAGEDDAGSPFFVMELVRGPNLIEFCDREELTTDQRLELFFAVCQAIQHAHQRGVIHRDLKPSNILVSQEHGSPVAKVIDFGIAKAVEPGDGSMMTQMGQIVGTPNYMSPEQAGILDGGVDTRTDIYSLGVLLYELLSGQLPHRFESGTQNEIRRAFDGQDPPKPSTAITGGDTTAEQVAARRTTLRRLTRELSGDLDNIVMMAIRKEPERRYPSVDAFADDIRRYRDGFPVRARRDTWRYRAGKFVRRNALGVAVSVAGVAALGAVAVTMVVQSARVAQERDRANVEAESARRVAEFMVELFEVSDPSEARGNSITAREVLDRGAARIGSELDQDPLVRASLMDAIGRVYMQLGLYAPSDSLLTEALAVRSAELGERHLDVATSQVSLAALLMDQGRFEAAQALYERALTTQRELLGDDDPQISDRLYNLGSVLIELGDLTAAEARFRALIESDIRVYGPDHENTALSHNDLGSVLWRMGNQTEAETHYRRALEIYIKVHGEDHPEVATTTANLGNLLSSKGDHDGAVEMSTRALELRRKLLGDDHPHVAISMNNLGNQLMRRGDMDQAEALIREGLDIKRRAHGDVHPTVAHSLISLGGLLMRQRKFVDAEVVFDEARTIHAQMLPEDHPRVARPLHGLGMVRLETGDVAGAEDLLRQALKIREETLPEDNPEINESRLALGRWAVAAGRFEEAKPLLLEGYQRVAERYGAQDLRTTQAARSLAALYQATGDEAAAARYRTLAGSTSEPD